MGFEVTHADGRSDAAFELKALDALMAELESDGEAAVSLAHDNGARVTVHASGRVVFEHDGEVLHRVDQSRNVAKRMLSQLAGNGLHWLKSLAWEQGPGGS